MADYNKSNPVSGKWFKSSEVKSGVKAKLKSETNPVPSAFTNKDGSVKMQDVAKILVQGGTEVMNISINRASIDGLVDAFGSKSKDWIDKLLTIETEKVRVAGKMVMTAYLVPEGYEKIDDEMGYAHIVKLGNKVDAPDEIDLNIPPDTEAMSDIPF